jgi:hypothetical protein
MKRIVASAIDRLGTLDLGAAVRDLVGLGGFAALFYGLAQWSRPLAWVVGGVLLVALWSLPYWRRKVSP